MRILLIKPKQIGDSLILTPTITAIKTAYPDAEIWVMVRTGCEGILAGCPDIARILTLAGVEKSDRRPGDFWRQAKMLLRIVERAVRLCLRAGRRASGAALCDADAGRQRRYSVKTEQSR